MKRFIYTAFILILTITAVLSCASNTGSSTRGPAGKIVIYTSMYTDIIDAMSRTLNRRFPGCNIEFIYGGTGQIQAKILEEQAAGRLGCDILMVAEPSYSLELKEKGMLHSYLSPEASGLAFDYDKEGFWYPVRISNMVLAYNSERNAKNSVPNSFYDFAHDGNVKDAISITNPLTSGTSMAAFTALRDRYGYDYFTALGRQNPALESGAVALTKLESGEYRVIMVLEEMVLRKRQEEGSKLEVIYPADGTIVIPSTIMIVADRWSANRNTKAAEMITDWFLTEEGQHAVVEAWMHSVRKDFDKSPHDAVHIGEIHSNTMPVNWENCYRQRDEIQNRFMELVMSLR